MLPNLRFLVGLLEQKAVALEETVATQLANLATTKLPPLDRQFRDSLTADSKHLQELLLNR